MSIEKCCKIMIKIIEHVIRLNFPKNLINKKCVNFNGKMDVCLKDVQTVYSGREDARYFEFQVTCLGPHSNQFEVRHFLNAYTQDKSFFHELENKLGSPCLRILLAADGERVQYSLHLPEPDTGWGVQAEETDEEVQGVTVALKIPLSTADLQTAEDAIVQYLKKVLLLHPVFCVSCHSQDKLLFRSRHLEQVKSATTWLGQLKTYCRVYGECDETTHFGCTTRKRNNNLPDVTVLYGCSTNITKVMTSNHLHVSVRNKDGLPVDVDVTQWCSLVHISSPSRLEVFPGSDKCNLGSWLPDVCYPVLGDISPICFLVVIIVNSQEFNLFLQKNHHTVSSRLTTTVASMITVTQDNKRYVQICDMTAAAVGSILRFSFNNDFRNRCYELLKTSCTAEAEVKFREMLSNTVTNVKQAINAIQERDDTQEKVSKEEAVPVMPQPVPLSPSPCASDLTDEEQFLNWDSPQNLLESPPSPSLISNSDLPLPNKGEDLSQPMACEPKENEEMQANRNTEVAEMSQAVSLRSSPNASDLTDEEKFLNWDSPHNMACEPKENEEMQANRNTEVVEMSQAVSLRLSPNASDLTDEEKFLNWDSPHNMACEPKENEEMQANRNTEVAEMSQAVSLRSSPNASDLTDEEKFLNWDSPHNMACEPKENEEMQANRNTEVVEMSQAVSLCLSPNASDLTDEEKFLNWDSPHNMACEPKENEEMQANRNTEVAEMSQAVSLRLSPNASDLTDEEKFLNWDSPHNDLSERHRGPCLQTSSLLEDDDTCVTTIPCADHKISSVLSVSTQDLMDDELFFEWETSESISVQLEE